MTSCSPRLMGYEIRRPGRRLLLSVDPAFFYLQKVMNMLIVVGIISFVVGAIFGMGVVIVMLDKDDDVN